MPPAVYFHLYLKLYPAVICYNENASELNFLLLLFYYILKFVYKVTLVQATSTWGSGV